MTGKKFTFSTVAEVLALLWFALFMTAAFLKWPLLSLVALLYTGAFPFILIVLFLSLTTGGHVIAGWFKIRHVKIFASALLVAYSIYAHKWAADQINSIFHVDSGHFLGTTSALIALFVPFGIIRQTELMSHVATIFFVASVTLALPFWIAVNISAAHNSKLNARKLYLWSLFVVFAGNAFFTVAVRTSEDFKPLVANFALWADFSDSNLCTDAWTSRAKGVVFLDNDRVLAHIPGITGSQFEVLTCTYPKSSLN